jgi:carotenoid phi-ring synthase / carotenoid chi-ring synthase
MAVMGKTYDVIIAGAGVAGLTAALHLAERGLKPLLLEADPGHAGGRLAGRGEITVKGSSFPAEHGVHGIWSSYLNFKSMLERYALLPGLVHAREEQWIYRTGSFVGRAPIGRAIRNSFIPAPFHYLQLFLQPQFLWLIDFRDWAALFNVWSVLIMAMGVDPFVEDQPLEGLMLNDLLKRWSPALRALFTGLTRNSMASDPGEVPAAGFIAFLRFYTLMRRDAWSFDYLPAGGSEVCDQLAKKIGGLGGELRLACRVTRVEQAEASQEWTVSWQRDGLAESDRAPFVILASDSPATASIIKNSFSAGSGLLFFPRGMANAVVRLWFDAPPRPGPEAGIFSGDFCMHNFFWLDQIYTPYRTWRAATGGACLETHVYGPAAALAQPDAILLAGVLLDLYRAFPELKGHLITPHVQRNPATHTLPALGAPESHLGIETPWRNLFCAGDWVRHPTPALFLERACVTGLEAANRVLAARGLQVWEIQGHPQPEALAGRIQGWMRSGRRKRREGKSGPG